MKLETKRISKVDNPLLIIGLGGTGSEALLTIMDKFHSRFELEKSPSGELLDHPKNTAYLAFDTDIIELQSRRVGSTAFRRENMFKLEIPARLATGTVPSYITSWWDQALTSKSIENGAGGIRQVGRYVLFHNVDAIVHKLYNTIDALLRMPSGETAATLEIVLTTGISGGTGSGTFLDMAYLVRYVLQRHFSTLKDYNFTAYVMMPSVNVDNIAGIMDSKRTLLETTGFAALKELDFWMNYHTHQYQYTQQYSTNVVVRWNNTPFDNVVLMGSAKRDGTLIQNAYRNCLDILSESVLNFFANEKQNGTGNSSISYRSHLSNVTHEKNFLPMSYPANYTYMSVGAAVSEAQSEAMVTYEANKTVNRIMELKDVDPIKLPDTCHAAPLLKTKDGEKFLEDFLPPDLDYFSKFGNELLDPALFSDPSYTPQVIHDIEPLHTNTYSQWIQDCDQLAMTFTVREVDLLRNRFKNLVKEYAGSLTYGPFVVRDYLKDAADGFLGFIERLVNLWNSNENDCQRARNDELANAGIFQQKVAEMNKLAMIAGLWGPVNNYKDCCLRLFRAARDYALARCMSAELNKLKEEIKAYATVILPAYCVMLEQESSSLASDLHAVTIAPRSNEIASMKQLENYINDCFTAAQINDLASRMLNNMIDSSLRVALDGRGQIKDQSLIASELRRAMENFVQQDTAVINGATMDDILSIANPGATTQEKVDYLAGTLLPKLKVAAQTMLPLIGGDTESNEYISYAYASIPGNAPVIRQGVSSYQRSEKITPKESDVTDRIYWLNTLNCVPLYMYADLARLEQVYSGAMEKAPVQGIHLVFSAHGSHELYNDWSLLPSPVVHQLQKIERPKTVQQRQKAIHEMMDEAKANGSITIEDIGGKRKLTVILRKNGDRMENMEQFHTKLTAITSNANLDADTKIAALKALSDEGTKVYFEYADYRHIFADSMNLTLTAPHNTLDELNTVSRNQEQADQMVAEYILYSQHPDIAEQLIAQKEMHVMIQQAIQKTTEDNAVIPGEFISNFLLLYFSGIFTFGRGSIFFKDVRGIDTALMTKSDFTADELTVYTDYCQSLVLMQILSNPSDTRISENDRRFLNARAVSLKADLERMSDADYDAIVSNAKKFREDYANLADAIRYDRGELPVPVREKNAELISRMIQLSKNYS